MYAGTIQRNCELKGCPGFKPEDVDISITGDTITIKGERKEEQEIKEDNYLYKERRNGTFTRSVLIPVKVKSDKAEAVFENGVLTLTLPKAEEVKPRQIKVKATQITEGKKQKLKAKKSIAELHSPIPKSQGIVAQSWL